MPPKFISLVVALSSAASSADAFQAVTAGNMPPVGSAVPRILPREARGKLEVDAGWLANSFVPRKYKSPWWARNPHVSTIIGSGEVQRKFFGRGGPKVNYRRERWSTPDGDFLDVDFLEAYKLQGENQEGGAIVESAPIAILTHGLESTSSAPLTAKMALA
ncbi:unnamed protein product [Choristocarpus tenellus]